MQLNDEQIDDIRYGMLCPVTGTMPSEDTIIKLCEQAKKANSGEVVNSIDHHQRLGRHADIIIEAINTYNGYMLDDDYNAQGTLDKIVQRMSERLAMDGTIPTPPR